MSGRIKQFDSSIVCPYYKSTTVQGDIYCEAPLADTIGVQSGYRFASKGRRYQYIQAYCASMTGHKKCPMYRMNNIIRYGCGEKGDRRMLDYIQLFQRNSEIIQVLTMEERGQLFTALFKYNEDQSFVPDQQEMGNAWILWPVFRQQIDFSIKSLAQKSAVLSENGKKGGRPRKKETKDAEDDGKEHTFNTETVDEVSKSFSEKAKKAIGFDSTGESKSFSEKANKAISNTISISNTNTISRSISNTREREKEKVRHKQKVSADVQKHDQVHGYTERAYTDKDFPDSYFYDPSRDYPADKPLGENKSK